MVQGRGKKYPKLVFRSTLESIPEDEVLMFHDHCDAPPALPICPPRPPAPMVTSPAPLVSPPAPPVCPPRPLVTPPAPPVCLVTPPVCPPRPTVSPPAPPVCPPAPPICLVTPPVLPPRPTVTPPQPPDSSRTHRPAFVPVPWLKSDRRERRFQGDLRKYQLAQRLSARLQQVQDDVTSVHDVPATSQHVETAERTAENADVDCDQVLISVEGESVAYTAAAPSTLVSNNDEHEYGLNNPSADGGRPTFVLKNPCLKPRNLHAFCCVFLSIVVFLIILFAVFYKIVLV